MSARVLSREAAARDLRGLLLLALLAVGLGGAVAVLPPIQGAALLLGAVLLPLVLARPLLGLCLAIATIPLSSEWSVNVGGLNLTLMEPAVGLAAVAWLLRGARERSLRIWPSGLLVAQLAVLALFLASSLAGEARGPSLKDTIKWIELLLVFMLTVDEAREAPAARWVVLALIGAAAFEAAYGIFQFATGRGPAFFAIGPFMRAHGHFGQPNPFAGYLGTALPLALAVVFLLPRDVLARWARPAAALLALAVALSFSRGAWLGIALATTVMLAVVSQRSRRWLVPLGAALLLLGVLGTLGLLPAAVGERLGIIAEYFGPFDVRRVELTPENWSVVERMAHWQAAWYMFLDHPWFGIGPGNYATVYDDYFLPGWLEPLGHAHNYYLNLAAEAGIFGMAAYVAVVVLAFRAAIRAARGRDPYWRALGIGVLGSLVAISLHSAFDNLYVHGVSVQIGALMGLAQVASDAQGAESERVASGSAPAPPGRPALLFGAGRADDPRASGG